ncbi:MAG: AAA family ATPase [Candidatus Anstonellales archaeon]
MLFDLKPKERVRDFFNYKEELNSLVNYLKDRTTRLVVLRGLRRTGKSSLLRVALNRTGLKYVLIDARELTSLSRRAFESKLFEKLKGLRGIPATLLDRIESVEVGVRISVKREESLWGLLKEIKPIIAVDEVQMLGWAGVDAFLAAVFDNTECKIVLTGSEVGILESFLGKDNPKAPLFGRVYKEIKTYPLSHEKAKEFLRAGFRQAGKEIREEEVDAAISELDGIIGWLTIFGNLSLSTKPALALRRAGEEGALLAYSELHSFLDRRAQAKGRYLALLRILARKSARWSELKRAVQIELKEEISDSQFTDYLHGLVDYGFIVKEGGLYIIPDPLLRKALMEKRA